jgi:transcriptional regulator with XRE-family HTH domain
MSPGEIVARNLRRIRKERDLSQFALADMVGIDKNYIGKIERQENSPTLAMIERIAKALKIEWISLLEEGPN